MRFPRITLIAGLGVAAALGCYRATVETGLTPSEQVIRKESASAWLGGLVGPEKVEAQKQCPNGVAQVKTEQSLLNQVVAYVTLGIYTFFWTYWTYDELQRFRQWGSRTPGHPEFGVTPGRFETA